MVDVDFINIYVNIKKGSLMQERRPGQKKRPSKKRIKLIFPILLIAVIFFMFYASRPESFRFFKNKIRNMSFDTENTYNAKSMLVIDRTDDNIYVSKLEDEKQHPASLAKLFTIEYAKGLLKLDTKIKVKQEALDNVKKGSSSAKLEDGETYTLKELFAAMLVPSGNDAAYVVADYVGGLKHPEAKTSKEKISLFIKDLNKHIKERSWKNTKILDPSGYDYEATTTANELKSVCDILLEEDWFRQIVSKPFYKVKLRNGTKKVWKNTNKFLNPEEKDYYNERVKGVKTGSLGDDYNLIVLYDTGKKEFLIISIGSTSDTSRYDDLSYLIKTIDESHYLNK